MFIVLLFTVEAVHRYNDSRMTNLLQDRLMLPLCPDPGPFAQKETEKKGRLKNGLGLCRLT